MGWGWGVNRELMCQILTGPSHHLLSASEQFLICIWHCGPEWGDKAKCFWSQRLWIGLKSPLCRRSLTPPPPPPPSSCFTQPVAIHKGQQNHRPAKFLTFGLRNTSLHWEKRQLICKRPAAIVMKAVHCWIWVVLYQREAFLCVSSSHCGAMTIKFLDTIKLPFANLMPYCHFSINVAIWHYQKILMTPM